MKILIALLLAGLSVVAHAEVYKCPQLYPGKDKQPVPLTSAAMTQDTDLVLAGGFMTDDEAAPEGYDQHYAFNTEWQTRLVCLYGNKKRVKGRFHDNHEWNQHMEDGGIEWSIKLAPKTAKCTLQVREMKSQATAKAIWTATALCE